MNDAIEGYLGATVRVTGRIEGRGDLVVAGQVDGETRIDGQLVVVEGGSVAGDVDARTVEIFGRVLGNVVGAESVAIRAGGHVEGDLRSSSVAVDDGGALHGGIDMEFSIEGQGA